MGGYPASAVADLASELRPFAAALLGDEELLGACVASEQKRLKGWMVTIAVGRERIVIQRMKRGREFVADGEPLSLRPEDIAGARAGGLGTWGASPTAEIMERAAIELKLRMTDGEKRKLMLMRGEGRAVRHARRRRDPTRRRRRPCRVARPQRHRAVGRPPAPHRLRPR